MGEASRQPRRAARIILLDEEGRVFLWRGADPTRPKVGTWWWTPGGGIDTGESVEAAARRELKEETGLEVGELGEVVLRRHIEFEFDGTPYSQDEEYFLVHCARFEISEVGWTDGERRAFQEHRWWSIEELRVTSEEIYPKGLLAFLESLPKDE